MAQTSRPIWLWLRGHGGAGEVRQACADVKQQCKQCSSRVSGVDVALIITNGPRLEYCRADAEGFQRQRLNKTSSHQAKDEIPPEAIGRSSDRCQVIQLTAWVRKLRKWRNVFLSPISIIIHRS